MGLFKMFSYGISVIFLVFTCIRFSYGSIPRHELDAKYWNDMGQADLNKALNVFENLKNNKAKNVIIFLGDGMSLSTVVAGRILKGQRSGEDGVKGEETVTAIDEMPHVGLLKTYSVNYQTPDSASTATAYLCGVKTKSQMLGVNARSTLSCQSTKGNEVDSILALASKAGKSTGVVTTTRVQHATPAGSYAHVPHRTWYSTKHVPVADKKYCKDIALQLREANISVVLGGGRAHMRPYRYRDEEYASLSRSGDRQDGRNLIREWLMDKPVGQTSKYVWNKELFDSINPDTTDRLMGLFEPYEMNFALDNKKTSRPHEEPTLSEMTSKAIKILRKNNEGFVLLVEGGLIDKGHHRAKPQYALEEFLEFEKAVQVGKDLTSDSDTLIIVTADHGHVFNIGGGTPIRGNPILGLSPDNSKPKKALDGKYYTSLSYGNGPGKRANQIRLTQLNLADENADTRLYAYEGTVPLSSESHSAEDVVAFARGPMAHLMHGVHEQTYVAHVMMYATCLGPYADRCNNEKEGSKLLSRAKLMNDVFHPRPSEEDYN